jgi:S1-C subfamily serine protease
MPSLMARTIGGGSILLALILAPAPAASAQTPPVVTRVVDADTITVSGVGSVDEKTGPKTGSAFAVHSSGKLLTNDHVVEGCSVVTVSSQGGNPVTGRIQARDVRNDLALIALNSPLFINCKFSEDADKVW